MTFTLLKLGAFKIELVLAWYDLWIGLFYDVRRRKLFVFFIPCIGFSTYFPKRERHVIVNLSGELVRTEIVWK